MVLRRSKRMAIGRPVVGVKTGLVVYVLPLLTIQCLSFLSPAQATEEYAERTGRECTYCHVESIGGRLNTTGFAFIRNGYQYPIPSEVLEKVRSFRSPVFKTVRFIVGYLHLLAAMVFFGAIFYIHIFVKPATLVGGIPRSERILGVSCMAALILTGIFLTWERIYRWEQFFNNTFGLMLFVKMALFAVMILNALFAITILHRRMGREAHGSPDPADAEHAGFSDVGRFDGTGGRPAYVLYENKVYDVSKSAKWKDGKHFGRHTAGTDLTEAMKGAPHGPEVLERVTYVGEKPETAPSAGRSPGPAHRVFVGVAYANLVIIFLILGCISVWRWDFPIELVP
ncbi:MAG: CopD family protein [Deltaproteobacteria bacterium]|nr:CopD family protein [Deltaproteobacteria bacterium]